MKNYFLTRSTPKKAIFIHIQKTAGTSIVHLAAKNYGNENIISHGDYVKYRTSDLVDIPFISGHFGFDYAKDLMDERKSFTFLREPEKRILSLYYFYRSQPADAFPIYQAAHDNSLEEFLKLGLTNPQMRPHLWNNQAWQLGCGFGRKSHRSIDKFSEDELVSVALENLKKIDYVGLTETFNKDIKNISKMLNWFQGDLVSEENKNINSPIYGGITSKERNLLSELTVLDNEIYSYVKNKKI